MCGIGLCIDCELDEKSIELLKRRGPDSYQTIQRTYSHCLTFYSSVLSQQGSGVESQPIETENTLLLFNGEIYWHPKFSTQVLELFFGCISNVPYGYNAILRVQNVTVYGWERQ